MRDELSRKELIGLWVAIIALVISIIAGLMYAIPVYNVWSYEKQGKARLMQATQERKILVEQAQAERDSAKLRAEAIEIIGEAAKNYPEYRSQEFMAAFGEALNNNPNIQLVYVPTEGMIPITEAYRFNAK